MKEHVSSAQTTDPYHKEDAAYEQPQTYNDANNAKEDDGSQPHLRSRTLILTSCSRDRSLSLVLFEMKRKPSANANTPAKVIEIAPAAGA